MSLLVFLIILGTAQSHRLIFRYVAWSDGTVGTIEFNAEVVANLNNKAPSEVILYDYTTKNLLRAKGSLPNGFSTGTEVVWWDTGCEFRFETGRFISDVWVNGVITPNRTVNAAPVFTDLTECVRWIRLFRNERGWNYEYIVIKRLAAVIVVLSAVIFMLLGRWLCVYRLQPEPLV